MNDSERYLCFDLGKEEFAIPLLSVREVIGVPDITPIPQMPAHFLGMINLRGSIVSVLDLRLKMNIKPTQSKETSIVILDLGEMHLGAVVDRVNSVYQQSKEQILPKPHLENSKINDAILGVFKKGEALTLILDVAKALSVEDKSTAAKAQKAA